MSKVRLLILVLLAPGAGCIGSDEQPGAGGEGSPEAGASPTALGWGEHASAPSERTEVTAAPLDPGGPRFLVVGGYFEQAHRSRLVERYDAAEDAWSPAPDYPIPVYHAAAVNAGGDVLVFGGHSTPLFAPTDHVYRFDEGSETWELETRMPVPRGGHDVTVVDGEVYLVGGFDAVQQEVARVDVYDPETGEWRQAPDLPEPRDHLSVESADGRVYAIGGREGSLDSNTGRVDVLEPGGEWTQTAPMPTPRGGMGAAVLNDWIVVAGGEHAEGTFAAVEAYDPANGTWTRLPDLPTARHGLGAGVWEDRFYTFLGGPEAGVSHSAVVESLG